MATTSSPTSWRAPARDERTPIHVGPDKVHLKVAFSRWKADGSLIGRFETIYIVTRQDGHWGIQARSSFAVQLPSFLVFILGGSLVLGSTLTHRNPSPALWLAAYTLPFCTFYAITSFLLGQTLGVCLFISAAYGFTAIAMLVPAVSEFDVALGRSTLDQG